MGIQICHCGKQFENTRVKGGTRKGGPRQKHCSARCAAVATKCRYYGLSTVEFWNMLSHGCQICGVKECSSGRQLAIDHEHVHGYSDLPAHKRRKYVRGLLCILCNKHRMADMTIEISKKMTEYLETYERNRSSRE